MPGRKSKQNGAGQIVALVVIAVILAAAYVALDFYSAGEVNVSMTESRGTQLVQGLTRYKLEVANYPDSLAKLTPKFLTAIPNCPDGAPFAYQLSGGEYSLTCQNVVFKMKPYGYDSRTKSWRG